MRKRTFTSVISGMALAAIFFQIPASAQEPADTLKEQVTTIRDRVAGVEERIATAENDLAKLTKIKLSGYVQAQWQHFENAATYPGNTITIRRARFKLQYEPATGVALVLQPDFQPGNFVIKEAYGVINDRWLKTFSIWAGKFNRPNYEVEYSSADLELLERSRLITSIYPGEYAIGAKLEVAPPKLPLKFQFAVFNGNDNMAVYNKVYDPVTGKWNNSNVNPDNKDFDNAKDLMARLTYMFKLGQWGGLTIGAHGYLGWMKAADTVLLNGDYTKNKTLGGIGDNVSKSWFGVEAQFYADILGGLAIKGEYIRGNNMAPGYISSPYSSTSSSMQLRNDTLFTTTTTTKTTQVAPAIVKGFQGYYIYLIKNIGKRHQLALRYDYYDPNTELSGSQIGELDANQKPVYAYDMSSTTTKTGTPVVNGNNVTTAVTKTVNTNKLESGLSDIAYGTLGIAWNYFFDDNIKISLAYEFPMNEKVGTHLDASQNEVGNVVTSYTVNGVTGTTDYSKWFSQNMLTLRIQAKF